LISLLPGCEGLTLIFVETKRGADGLENFLVQEGINATSIHGDRSQPEREEALSNFKCGRCPVLVATDVAARGLDIPNVLHVINYDLPNNIDDYVHRIGRTGRCGNTGTAIAFVNEKNKPILRDLRDLLDETKQEIPRWFDGLISRESYGGGGGGGGRGRGRGGRGSSRSFGARDARDGPRDHGWNDRPSSGFGNRNNTSSNTSSSFGPRGGTPRGANGSGGGGGGGGGSRGNASGGDYGGRSFNRKFSNDGGDAW